MDGNVSVWCRNPSKQAAFLNDNEMKQVSFMPANEPMKLVEDPETPIIAELMGGADGLAWEVSRETLKRGKVLVTANKALLAKHMKEIEVILHVR